jgi:6-phosphofructokinase 1
MKRIAILTSGGDAPGMNACIRAVVHSAAAEGIEVLGVRRGYEGLMDGDMEPMSSFDVFNIIQTGGSVLESSRSDEFKTSGGRKKAIGNLMESGVEGLIVVGGDGSLRGARSLAGESDVSVLGVPGTIDNDLYGTDFSIGFDTATNFAVEAIDRVRDIARTFERVFFVEVMGHHAGYLALHCAVAGGAEGVIIPEDPEDLDDLCARLEEGYRLSGKSAVVVVAETQDPGHSYEIAREVGARTGFETRVCVLGYLQRGGRPTAGDRILGSKLGVAAVQALLAGVDGEMVGEIGNAIEYTSLEDACSRKKGLNQCLLELVQTFPPTGHAAEK